MLVENILQSAVFHNSLIMARLEPGSFCNHTEPTSKLNQFSDFPKYFFLNNSFHTAKPGCFQITKNKRNLITKTTNPKDWSFVQLGRKFHEEHF